MASRRAVQRLSACNFRYMLWFRTGQGLITGFAKTGDRPCSVFTARRDSRRADSASPFWYCSPHALDEAKACRHPEGIVSAGGVSCLHCDVVSGQVHDLSGVKPKTNSKNREDMVRHRLGNRGECRKLFTVKVGTVFEHAHRPLSRMPRTVQLMVWSTEGIRRRRLGRVFETQYKNAWFLAHRIREAMRSGNREQSFGSNRSEAGTRDHQSIAQKTPHTAGS